MVCVTGIPVADYDDGLTLIIPILRINLRVREGRKSIAIPISQG